MHPEEVLLTIDEIRAERRNFTPLQLQDLPLGEHVYQYTQSRNPQAPASLELLSSIEYSLDLCRFLPQVELFRAIAMEQSKPEALYNDTLQMIERFCKSVAGQKELIRPVQLGRLKLRAMKRKQFYSLLDGAFPTLGKAILRLRVVEQSELTRFALMDPKGLQSLLANDDVPLEALLSAPDGTDGEGYWESLPTGSPLTRTQASLFKKSGSSLLSSFCCAIFRALVDQYEVFVQYIVFSIGLAIESAKDVSLCSARTALPGEEVLAVLETRRNLRVPKSLFVQTLQDVIVNGTTGDPPADIAAAIQSIATVCYSAEYINSVFKRWVPEKNVAEPCDLELWELAVVLRTVYLPFKVRVESSFIQELSSPTDRPLDATRSRINLMRSLSK
jgi:hypothetical protein